MQDGDVHGRESLTCHAARHVGSDVDRPGQLAETGLRRDLPRGCRTDKDAGRLIADRCARFSREAAASVEPPQERVSIEQEPHVTPSDRAPRPAAARRRRG